METLSTASVEHKASSELYCAAGTVLGREHARLHRNNQDGVAFGDDGEIVAAVVTDGCSSGRYSEVGARFGASALAARAPALRRAHPDDHAFADAAVAALLDALAPFVAAFPRGDARRVAFVRDHLLFTFLAAVWDRARDHAIVFGLGDGVVSIDGALRVLDPGPENAPSYLGYALLDASALTGPVGALSPTLHHRGPARTIAIATDGAMDLLPELPALASDPRLSSNASLLHKRLVVLGEHERRLRDDTTVAVLRREPPSWTS